MTMRKGSCLVGTALAMLLLCSARAEAHWCDDLWASSYNIVVRPDSDTSPKEVYVQNNMGYQLISFKLTATATSGAITLTAPTTLKVAGTLLPGEKGTWKIASGSPAKIEDITFSVSFGNSGESKCYPTKGANAVMIVKKDGSLYPASSPLPGLDSPVNPGCVGDLQQGRSLQYEAMADFENLNTGLDKLLGLYCSGRASWNSGSDQVSPSYCKDSSSTSCPTTKPTSGTGSKYDYMHLWSAGELAIRKGSLGARAAVFRARLACGTNDGDLGFAGYAAFILGYLGDDASAKATLQGLVTAGGDLGTIAKAGLYVMGDTAQKADVQAGLKASSLFVQVACAAAVGIVDNDDASVTSVIIPAVKWNEPDSASEDGKGMYAAHVLELVAFQRRGWVANGVGTGTVTFYGETGSGGGTGGAAGTGGAVGTGGATGGAIGTGGGVGTGGAVGTGGIRASGGAVGGGGAVGRGGATGSGGSTAGAGGGTASAGGAVGSGGSVPSSGGAGGSGGTTAGSGGTGPGSGGASGTGGGAGSGGSKASGGTAGNSGGTSVISGGISGNATGGSSGSGGTTGGGSTTSTDGGSSTGCKCNLGGHGSTPVFSILAVAGPALLVRRRRR